MGIAGLLNLLSGDVLEKIDDYLSTWKKPGTGRIGVDAYNWVYKVVRSSTYTSDAELANRFMFKVSNLQKCGLTPYIVFDGAKLPVKEAAKGSNVNMKKTEFQLCEAPGGVREVDTFNKKSSKVTHENVWCVIQTLKRNDVKFVVAPYEADPQLAFLLRESHVDVILTADADLILYGCEKIIFDYNGDYYEYDSSTLVGSNLFGGFTKEMILQACMLGGCDYLSNLPGVGLNRAIEVMKDRKKMMTSVDDYLEVLKALKPTDVDENDKLEYIKKFTMAMITYRHQRVYDPTRKIIVCLSNFSEETEEDFQPYIGPQRTSHNISAEDIANGIIHPITNKRMEANMHIVGGYVHSEVEVIDKEELLRNHEMEKLFNATSTLKVMQEAMLNAAEDHCITHTRQIVTDMKVAEASQKYEEVDNDLFFLGEAGASFGASFRDMSNNKIKEAEEYKAGLKKEVIKPLKDLITDASLHGTLNNAEVYSRTRQEAEIEVDQLKLEKLKEKLQTSSLMTREALSKVKEDHKIKTSKILVEMFKLEFLHCKKLYDILAAIPNETV